MCCGGSYSLSLSRRELCSFLIWLFGVSLSFGDPISVALHARWTPDLTANPQQPQCVTSGTVAGGVEFHVIANFSPPVIGFGVDSIDILEQTDVHEPFHYHSDSPISGDTYSSPPYNLCSSPPTGYQTWVVCNLNVPIMTFSFHNTNYVITANYHYIVFTGAYPPSPGNPMYRRVDGSLSITVKFDNLIVQSQPKILKWDPDNSANCDTTFSYTLSSAQKKNCQVLIDIYSTEGAKVYETTLTQLCPGTYTFTWDGTANQTSYPPNNIAPAGLYTFDISVQGACPYDTDKMRSFYLTISNISIAPQVFCPCFDEETNINFTLSENTLGNLVVIHVFNKMKEKEKDMKEIARFTQTVSPGQNSWQWDGKNQKGIKLNVGKEGGYGHKRPSQNEPYWYRDFCIVIEATDSHSDYKSHQPKPALPIGITGRIYSDIVKGARTDICFQYGSAPGKKVCTDVVYDALLSAGIDLSKPDKVGSSYRWAPSVYAYFKNHGYLVSQPYCIGDIIFMRFKKDGPHHVGVITAVDENTGKIKSVVHASSTKNHVWEQPGNPYPNNFQVGRHPKP